MEMTIEEMEKKEPKYLSYGFRPKYFAIVNADLFYESSKGYSLLAKNFMEKQNEKRNDKNY